jgi:hypothetical protein
MLYCTCITLQAGVPVHGWPLTLMTTCGGWDPSGESDNSKSEQVKQCMGLEHYLHCLHLEPTHLLLPIRFILGLAPTVCRLADPDLVDKIQVHKVQRVSQSKSGNVWIYDTVYTGYTWSPLTYCTTLSTLATLGAHSPGTCTCYPAGI